MLGANFVTSRGRGEGARPGLKRTNGRRVAVNLANERTVFCSRVAPSRPAAVRIPSALLGVGIFIAQFSTFITVPDLQLANFSRQHVHEGNQ